VKIGLISDTHGWIHPRLFELFSGVDEIWHAGDIGNIETADKLAQFKPLRAVYGNADDAKIRMIYPENLHFMSEGVKVWMVHMGGQPGRYDRKIRQALLSDPPDLFICGHSHIAKVIYDKKGKFLFLNPGAAGYHGFHKIMTAFRFETTGNRIVSFEIIELGDRGRVTV
jgi:uncharacterized protein